MKKGGVIYTASCGEAIPQTRNVSDNELDGRTLSPILDMVIQRELVLYDGSKGSLEDNECKEYTGGWTNEGYTLTEGSINNQPYQPVSKKLFGVDLDNSATSGIKLVGMGTVNAISVKGYKKLCLEVSSVTSTTGYFRFFADTSKNTTYGRALYAYSSNPPLAKTYEIDLTTNTLGDNLYIATNFSHGSANSKVVVTKVWLE